MLKLMLLLYRRYFLKYFNIKYVICLYFSFFDNIQIVCKNNKMIIFLMNMYVLF